MQVSVKCPVCYTAIEVDMDIYEDWEGDPNVIGGTNHYLNYEDYSIDFTGHEECKESLLKVNLINWRNPSFGDRLLELAFEAACEAYRE